MNFDEFFNHFERLIKAFSPTKPDEKAKIYFEETKNINTMVFARACSELVRQSEKFPTIFKILEKCEAIRPTKNLQAQSCFSCNGFGTASLWNHTFRVNCVHGSKVSKAISLLPENTNDLERCYMNLSREWEKIYNRPFPHDINAKVIL